MQAFEANGTLDPSGALVLEMPVPIAGSRRVRVLILLDEDPEPSEAAWLRSASTSPAFDFLDARGEDLYSADDGEPFHAEG